jgi:acyl dehydratase
MSVNPAVIGKELGPVERTWTARDVMLYALGVGAGTADPSRELHLTTENSRDTRLQVLPTFAVLLAAWPPSSDMGDFRLSQVLHAEQAVRLPADLPASGSARAYGRVMAIDDKGSAAVIRMTNRIESPTGELLAESEQAIYVRGEGGFGGPRGSRPAWTRPERDPDGEVAFTTRPDQALLYRLSGDTNPLHSDPSAARDSGFERPILHGLCAYGIAGRLLTQELCGGDTSRVEEVRTRFSSPVFPGDTLVVRYWRTADGALYQCLAGERIVLDHGVFLHRGAPQAGRGVGVSRPVPGGGVLYPDSQE